MKFRIPPRLHKTIDCDCEYMEVPDEDQPPLEKCLLSATFELDENEVHISFHNRTTELTFDLDQLYEVCQALMMLRGTAARLKRTAKENPRAYLKDAGRSD